MAIGKRLMAALRLWLVLVGLFFTATATAANELDSALLDRWLVTANELAPMREVFERIANESELAQQYTYHAFSAMSRAQQDQLLDQLLKSEAIHQQVYQVLHKQDWPSAGQFVRVGSRLAVAVQALMQDTMLQKLPAVQAQIVQEMMGGRVEAPAQDVALVRNNWSKISELLKQHMTVSELLAIMQ
jgi:hypothetical protein